MGEMSTGSLEVMETEKSSSFSTKVSFVIMMNKQEVVLIRESAKNIRGAPLSGEKSAPEEQIVTSVKSHDGFTQYLPQASPQLVLRSTATSMARSPSVSTAHTSCSPISSEASVESNSKDTVATTQVKDIYLPRMEMP